MKNHLRWSLALMLLAITFSTQAQDFWQPTNGPYGIGLWSSLVTQDGTYYGGGGNGVIYRKLPGQDKWAAVYEPKGGQPTILALHEHEEMVYAGGPSTMVYSADNGNSWTPVENFPGTIDVRGITENELGEIIAATTVGIYRGVPDGKGSTDWQLKVTNSQYGNYFFSVCLDKATGVLYGGSARGVYRSDDDGETWTLMGLEDMSSIMTIAVNAAGDVYVGTSGNGVRVHRANDPNPNGWVLAGIRISDLQVRRLDIINGNEIYASLTGNGLYRSTNNGAEWIEVLPIDGRAGTHFDPVANQIVTGTLKGVWVAPANAANPVYRQIGIPLEISSIYSYDSKVAVIGDHSQALFFSDDQGANWITKTGYGDGVLNGYAEKANGDIFVGTRGGISGIVGMMTELFVTPTDRVWFYTGFPASVLNINDVLVTSKDSVYVATDGGFYYMHTKDHSANRRSLISNKINILSLAEGNNGKIYAATDKGLYSSTDDGLTWSEPLLSNSRVLQMAIDGEHVLAATSKGLFDVAPEGVAPLVVGAPGEPVNGVTVDMSGHVYATTDKDVFYAESRAGTFIPQSEGVEGYEYGKVHTLRNEVYVATNFGLYKHIYAGLAEVTLSGLGAFTFDGAAHTATATTVPAGLPVKILYNGLETLPVQGGLYDVSARIDHPQYVGTKKGKILINKAAATVTLSGLGIRYYNSSAHSVTAVTNPPGLPVVITYQDKLAAPVDIGEYFVKGVIDHPSYHGSVTGDLTIQDIILGIEDKDEQKDVSVYPVPSRNGITVRSEVDKIYSITIYNALGKAVDHVSFDRPVSQHDMDTATYPEGVLVVKVTTEKSTVMRRAQIIR